MKDQKGKKITEKECKHISVSRHNQGPWICDLCRECVSDSYFTNPQPTQDWEVDFDSYFGKDQYGGVVSFRQDNVKSFIKSLLQSQRAKVIEECVGKIKKENEWAKPVGKEEGDWKPHYQGYNECLKNVIFELNKLK